MTCALDEAETQFKKEHSGLLRWREIGTNESAGHLPQTRTETKAGQVTQT